LADAGDHELQLGGQAVMSELAIATISNMAVAERHRRRGLGRRLLAACEQAASLHLAPPAAVIALAVYRTNAAAIELYESSGYRLDGWVDPRWAEAAERGRTAGARRQLMYKPLPSLALASDE
jgi:ribosomal protein S18 acetylase RimI-like enzyme